MHMSEEMERLRKNGWTVVPWIEHEGKVVAHRAFKEKKMLPWKHAAKLYRNKHKAVKREVERQQDLNYMKRDCIFKQGEIIDEQAAYIAELERLIETGTEGD